MQIKDIIMSIITARIPDTLDKALTEVAKSMERSKNFIVLKAIQNYVLELQEDIEDYTIVSDWMLAEKNNNVWH